MFYNNLLSIPILLVFSLIAEDWSTENVTRNFPPAEKNSLIIAMIFSGLSTVAISYASAWCVRVTSSTTYRFVITVSTCPQTLTFMQYGRCFEQASNCHFRIDLLRRSSYFCLGLRNLHWFHLRSCLRRRQTEADCYPRRKLASTSCRQCQQQEHERWIRVQGLKGFLMKGSKL